MLGFGLGLGLTQRRAGVSNAAILALFSNGEQGAWYDPSDLTTMFQDAAGTVPVTADGQPVGLALDKRLWGGKTLAQVIAGQPELAPNSDAVSSWTAGANHVLSTVNGQLRIAASGTGFTYRAFSTVVGRTYRVASKYTDVSGAVAQYHAVRKADNSSTTANVVDLNVVRANGSGASLSAVFTATATTTYLILQVNGPNPLTVDFGDISIKAIPGNHSQQTNVAARRTYKTNGTLAWLWDDNSDDAMPVTFGNLGSNCTVAYATASGVTILTAQTISGVYNVPGKGANLYGCIIIDRALTPSETASVTAWLKKKAGL